MSIQSAFEAEGIEFPMNPPEDGWDGVADVKIFPDGSKWIVCPYCRKKAVKILPDTKIHKMPYKCKGSGCKKEFLANVE